MANYAQPLGMTMAQLIAAQKESASNYLTSSFTWRYEYLPVIVGFVGVLGIAYYRKHRKKKRKA